MRIAVGAFLQETNDFSPVKTTKDVFLNAGVQHGDEILNQSDKIYAAELKAFLHDLKNWDEPATIVPLAALSCFAQGRMTEETFEWGCESLLTPLTKNCKAEGPVDGVLLALHGAMVAEGVDDCEGTILERVRQVVGPGVPIVTTLDLHVHTTLKMTREADALVFYHKIPHVDIYETGQRAAKILHSILYDDVKPVSMFVKLPLHLPVERVNTEASFEDVEAGKYAAFPPYVSRRLMALEKEEWCISAGLGTTQPWLNVTDLGATFVIAFNDSMHTARSRCHQVIQKLALDLWEARFQYMPAKNSLLSVKDAVMQAHEYFTRETKLVAIGDGADATTSGAPGDSTWLLKELLRYAWPAEKPALVTIVSEAAVNTCLQSGENSEVNMNVGGCLDCLHSQPIKIHGIVEKLFIGTYDIEAGHCAGMHCELGQCAVVRILTANMKFDAGVRLILTSGTGAHFARELFKLAGYDPESAASVIICKSPAGFRATYGSIAGLLLSADAEGCAPAKFWDARYAKDFSKKQDDLFPFDNVESYTPNIYTVDSSVTKQRAQRDKSA
eukprot:m.29683 g.29683  ORF g.29683 m.29683 type:complete len:557 (+) comp8126_c0_seq2:114-1784(+)